MELLVVAGFVFIAVLIAVVAHQRGSNKSNLAVQTLPTRPPASPRPASLTSKRNRELSNLLPPQFIVLDLETTGLSAQANEIIEIGAIRATLSSDSHLTYHALVRPSRRIPKRITQITGFTQEMVDIEGVGIREALVGLMEFVGDLPIVTFNAEFDIGFLCNAAAREGIAFKNRYACALKRARRA